MGIEQLVRDFPQQCAAAEQAAAALPFRHAGLSAVVLAGMGGSGMAADLAAEALGVSVPVSVVKGDTLPAFAGARTLVVAISYSGDTRETLRVAKEAATRGCPLAAVTSGGRLAALAKHAVLVPGGMPPRASTPSLFFGIAAVLAAAGLAKKPAGIGAFLEARRARVAQEAAAVARHIAGALPLVYSSSGVAVRRCCGQLNENAKLLAHGAVFPEANHNETACFQEPLSVPAAAVFLRLPDEGADVRTGLDYAAGLAARQGIPVRHVMAEGATAAERLFFLAWLADSASVAAARLRQVDPDATPAIAALKRRLEQNGPV